MSVRVIKDLFKYKQSPYYEKENKDSRTKIQRVLRHSDKMLVQNEEEFDELEKLMKETNDIDISKCSGRE